MTTNNIWAKYLIGYITILFIAGIACLCSVALFTTPPENVIDWNILLNKAYHSELMDYLKIAILIDLAISIALLSIMALFSISIKKYIFFAPATIFILCSILASIVFIFSTIGIAAISALAGSFSVYVAAILIITMLVLGGIYAVSFYKLINSSI